MSAKPQADAFSYGLVKGLVTVAEIVAWADGVIAETDAPEDWQIDLSLSGKKSPKEVLALLHRVPGSSCQAVSDAIALDYLARLNRPFALYGRALLPDGFTYPERLVAFSKTGQYPYLPTVWFIDANSSGAERIVEHVQLVDRAFVPFAQEDDRFTCFLSSASNAVHIVDIVERTSANFGTFDSWLDGAVAEARSMVHINTT